MPPLARADACSTPSTVLMVGLLAALGCGSSTSAETGASTATASSDPSETSASESSGPTGAETETGMSESTESTESTETETESETGEMCTGEACASTLTLEFSHSLPLAEGPHRFYVDTPIHSIICSVGTSPEGAESCFGFMFSDLVWTSELVTLTLTQPFHDTDLNPEATPFESVNLRVERGQDELFAATIPIDGGEPLQPDPCGPVCWQAHGSVTVE